MNFDIFLCCAQKDYVKLPYTVRAIQQNVPGYDGIYICTPTRVKMDISGDNVHYFLDKEVLDVNPLAWKYRSSWIYQQFLKLFQVVSPNQYYATIDTDVFVRRCLPFFTTEGKPIWYMGWPQEHSPYFRFQEKMFGFGKVYNYTFVSDMNLFNRNMIHEMLSRSGYTVTSFLSKSIEVIDNTCYPAEPELYGSYMHKYHPGFYEYRKLKIDLKGKPQNHPLQNVYSKEEIESLIQAMSGSDYDVITMHSWCTKNDVGIWNEPYGNAHE